MGLGHVPPGSIPRPRPGVDLPRRQCRGARDLGAAHLSDPRRSLGAAGEHIAAAFLSSHGLIVQGSNVEVDGGEVDLVALDGAARVVIEVRTTTGRADPIDAVDGAKRRHVTGLARRLGATRVDFVGVRIGEEGLDVHWVAT